MNFIRNTRSGWRKAGLAVSTIAGVAVAAFCLVSFPIQTTIVMLLMASVFVMDRG